MAEVNPQKTGASVAAFLNTIGDDQVRKDCKVVAELMEQATKSKGKMWGRAIVGFGSRRYRYPNGREMDWMIVGFSPRKQNIALYVLGTFPEQDALLEKLGTHSRGKGCLYIKRLSDVHVPTLKKLVNASVRHVKRRDASA